MKFNLKLVDNTYIGVLNGELLVSNNLTEEQLKVLLSVKVTEEEILQIFNPKVAEVASYNKEVQEIQDVLLESGMFEFKDGSYYRTGNPVSAPKMLLNKYVSYLNAADFSMLDALDNFWLKNSLNPNVYARENLFEYLQRWEFVITTKGYIVTYRNVNVKQQSNKELHDFIALNYSKVKSWKKSPKNYYVLDNDGEYLLQPALTTEVVVDSLGTLQELYENLSNLSETVYTDAHSGKTEVRIGEVVSIPREECDESQQECSRGLHTASSGWLKKGYYGEEGLVCLVNPMDIVSVPKGDYGKMRSSSYLPIGLAEYDDEGRIIPVATDLFEEEYDKYTIEELNNLLQSIDASNQIVHALDFKGLPAKVYHSLDKYQEILKEKNINLYEEQLMSYDDEGDYEDDDFYYYNY